MGYEQRIRAVLFYLSIGIFFFGLPFILSFSLGYKFDRHAFKFTKTGLVIIKTQPEGAEIYLDGTLLKEKTPGTINELLPAAYNLEIKLKDYYPWSKEIKVEANKIARLEKIILFPVRPDIKQLNQDPLGRYLIDEDEKAIYYINTETSSIYRSNLEGERYKWVGDFINLQPPPLEWKLSPDKEKLLYFNAHQIGIVYFQPYKEPPPPDPQFVLDLEEDRATDVFWHSDSYHLVLVTDKNIKVLESNPDSQPLSLLSLNRKKPAVFYHTGTDTLYFSDYEKAADGKLYNNLYKLDLRTRISTIRELMSIKPDEKNP